MCIDLEAQLSSFRLRKFPIETPSGSHFNGVDSDVSYENQDLYLSTLRTMAANIDKIV